STDSCGALRVASDAHATVEPACPLLGGRVRAHTSAQNPSRDGKPIHTQSQTNRRAINSDAILDLLLISASERIFSPLTAKGELSGFTKLALSLQRTGYTSTLAPLVSCLMLSRGERFPALHAIECFQRQTYPHRELVVVIDRPKGTLAEHIAELDDSRIRVVTSTEERALGQLRNLAVASAQGEYVCNWDDDDLSAPDRIQAQLDALHAHDAAACVLRRL